MILSLALAISGVFLILNLCKVDVLLSKYLILLILSIILITVLLIFIYTRHFKFGFKLPFVLIGILLISLETIGTYNLGKTANFVSEIVNATLKEEVYNIYVLKDSKFSSLDDLNGTKLGIYDNDNENLEEALKSLKKKVTFKSEKTYNEIETLLNAGITKSIDTIFISTSVVGIIEEEYSELMDNFKVLDNITVSFEEVVQRSDVDVTKEPFIVYISGIDTYGNVGTVSRSDVNMLAVINPITNKILLINTPRDYYVMLHSKKAYDKLTHAGIYGIEESLKTLEDLYVADIDFYIRINFSSLIKIVDALGGVTVNSKYSFSYDGHTFKKGTNYLNGQSALAFARCRKELPNGDIGRGENQQALIRGIIDKVTNPSIIGKYTSILGTLSKSFVTNMQEDDIYKLAKYQISENPKWNIETKNVNGIDALKTTYSMGGTKLYVMLPDENSVTEVKNAINSLLKEK